jgi:hypothetical protein
VISKTCSRCSTRCSRRRLTGAARMLRRRAVGMWARHRHLLLRVPNSALRKPSLRPPRFSDLESGWPVYALARALRAAPGKPRLPPLRFRRPDRRSAYGPLRSRHCAGAPCWSGHAASRAGCAPAANVGGPRSSPDDGVDAWRDASRVAEPNQ